MFSGYATFCIDDLFVVFRAFIINILRKRANIQIYTAGSRQDSLQACMCRSVCPMCVSVCRMSVLPVCLFVLLLFYVCVRDCLFYSSAYFVLCLSSMCVLMCMFVTNTGQSVLCVCLFARRYTHTYIRMYIHTYIRASMHTHTSNCFVIYKCTHT